MMKQISYNIHKFFNKEKTLPNLTKDQAIGMLSTIYQNPAFMRYLDARERYLIDNGMEQFMGGNPIKADRLAGQLFEVREIRHRIRSAYNVTKKLHDEKALKKAKNKKS